MAPVRPVPAPYGARISPSDELSGTLQGTAVALLFVLVALLIDLIYMVHRTSRASAGG